MTFRSRCGESEMVNIGLCKFGCRVIIRIEPVIEYKEMSMSSEVDVLKSSLSTFQQICVLKTFWRAARSILAKIRHETGFT